MPQEPKYAAQPDAIDRDNPQPQWKRWTLPRLLAGPWIGCTGADLSLMHMPDGLVWYLDHGTRPGDGDVMKRGRRMRISEERALLLLEMVAAMRREVEQWGEVKTKREAE
jgi:hypothetical protein